MSKNMQKNVLSPKELGKRYKKLRQDKSRVDDTMTQGRLGIKLGISKKTISAVETGKRSPSKKVIDAYHQHFKVSREYLRGESDVKNFDYLEVGKALGLSDKIITSFYGRKNKEKFVEVLNNIFDLGFGWEFLERLHNYFNADTDIRYYKKCIPIPIKKEKSVEAYLQNNPDLIEDIHEVRLHRLLREIKQHYHDDEGMREILRAGKEH